MAGLRHRQSRARFVAYLARGTVMLDVHQREDVVERLTYRDLALLSSYLPDANDDWDTLIERRLAGAQPHARDEGDDGRHAHMHASAMHMQRLSRRGAGLTPALVMRHRPSHTLLIEHRWLRLQVGRVLLQSLHRASAGLVEILERLSELPPECVEAASLAGGQLYPHEGVLRALSQAVGALSLRPGPVPSEALEILVKELPAGLHTAGLLRTLARLARLPRPSTAHWRAAREEAVAILRQLTLHARAPAEAGPLGARFCLALAHLLPKTPMADDADPLAGRLAWLNAAQGSLANAPDLEGADDGWGRVLRPLLVRTRERLQAIVVFETRACNDLVRARVQVLSQNQVGAREVRLRLELQGEGMRRLTDVRLEVDASGAEGLEASHDATLSWQQDIAYYPAEARTVVLRGAVSATQKRVRVVTRVSDRQGYAQEDVWWVTLASASLSWAANLLYPEALRATFETLRDQMFTPQGGAALLIVDEDVGRDAFLEAATTDYNARLHDARTLLDMLDAGAPTAERVKRIFERLRATGPARPHGPCVVNDAGALFDELGHDGPGDAPLDVALQTWHADATAGRLVLVASGSAAARHAERCSRLEHWDANRPRVQPASREIVAWLRREGSPSTAEAERVAADLGGDLRLIRRWPEHFKAHREAPSRREPLPAFLDRPEVAGVLVAELAQLDDRALLLAMAGAIYDTQLPLDQAGVGHVARDDLTSRTGKGAGRTLQLGGGPLSDSALRALRAERAHPTVWVEGYGTPPAARSRLPTRLAELLAVLGRRRVPNTPWLGSEQAGVWRTTSPYRQLIRGLYEREESASIVPLTRDAAVFRLLRCELRLLADVCTLDELARLSDDLLGVVLPATSVESRRLLRHVLRLWRSGPTEEDEALLRASFGPPDLHLAAPERAAPHTLEDLARRPGVRLYVGGGALRTGVAAEYLYWLEHSQALTLADVRHALEGLLHDAERHAQPVPGVRLTGPGARNLGFDEERHIGVLTEADLRWAAARGDLRHGLEQRRRAQQPLSARSPYRSTGALPPGSPLFKGRLRELDFVREHVRQHCVLIVGARRIGKTSLLNQIAHWVESQTDLQGIALDLQGVGSMEQFESALRRWADAQPRVKWTTGESSWLHRIVTGIQCLGRRPVFLLNEIDRPLRACRELFEQLRGFVESPGAHSVRCVMVGYATALRDLSNPESPLYHFAEGLRADGSAITLRNLDRDAACGLIDLLEHNLDLVWAPGQKEPSYELLLARSYGIPWLLQKLCQALVERLEAARRPEITHDDVLAVVAHAGDALEPYLAAKVGEADDAVLHSGLRLVLLALARARYWLPRAGVRALILDDRGLDGRNPLDTGLGFSVGQAVEIAATTFQELLTEDERKRVLRWFRRQKFDELFRLLTLTLVLELDPAGDKRFGFLLHIFPRELWRRHGPADPRLERAFTDEAREFWVLYESATKGAR